MKNLQLVTHFVTDLSTVHKTNQSKMTKWVVCISVSWPGQIRDLFTVPGGGRNRGRLQALDTAGRTSLEIGHDATRAAPPSLR